MVNASRSPPLRFCFSLGYSDTTVYIGLKWTVKKILSFYLIDLLIDRRGYSVYFMILNETLLFPRTLIDMMNSLSLNARGHITLA